MNKEQIVDKLKSSTCHFTFKKVNGDTRDAVGTLQADKLPEFVPSDNKKVPKDDVVCYYDVEAKAWRSFKVQNFIKFF